MTTVSDVEDLEEQWLLDEIMQQQEVRRRPAVKKKPPSRKHPPRAWPDKRNADMNRSSSKVEEGRVDQVTNTPSSPGNRSARRVRQLGGTQ